MEIPIITAIAEFLRSLVYGRREDRRSERRLEMEESREADRREDRLTAKVTVRTEQVEPGGKSWRDRLVVENEGPATARDVRLKIDGHPVDQDPRILEGPSPGFALGVESPLSYRVKAIGAQAKDAEVAWTWEDGREGRQTDRTRVQFT